MAVQSPCPSVAAASRTPDSVLRSWPVVSVSSVRCNWLGRFRGIRQGVLPSSCASFDLIDARESHVFGVVSDGVWSLVTRLSVMTWEPVGALELPRSSACRLKECWHVAACWPAWASSGLLLPGFWCALPSYVTRV